MNSSSFPKIPISLPGQGVLELESLFGENPQTSGSIELEGNTIEYEVDDEYITLTVTDEKGETTTITFPLNSFTF